MNEQLLDKTKSEEIITNDNNKNIKNINYSMIFLVILASSYSVLFITMAININDMTNNLNKNSSVMNIIEDKQINTTTVDYIKNNLYLIQDCVLHKYCKRVPD